MPTQVKPKFPSQGLGSFFKKNWGFGYGGGAIAGLMVASDLKGIADADNKLKALLKTLKDFVLIRVAMVGVFTAVGVAIKSLVRDTGSLDEALKKLAQIQQYSRQFQQFTGSMQSAKQRVAELYQLSLRRPFKFEDIVEANKSLEIFTRGAFSSVKATQQVGQAAIASGNNIQDTARAVGNFYEQLRSGQPIASAVEQLRQMGLISETTANHLENMSTAGASTATVFDELTESMKKTAEGAAGYKKELANVTEEHQKAVEELQRAFGSPWTEADVKNTQNWTKATQAITPTVAKISGSLAILYKGFGTVTSAIAKYLAQSKVVQAGGELMAKGIMAATVAAGVYGTVVAANLIPTMLKLSSWAAFNVGNSLLKMGVATGIARTAAISLGWALRGLMVGGAAGLVAAFAVSIAGAMYKMHKAMKEEEGARKEQLRGMRRGNTEMAGQIAGITTLTQKHEMLVKSLGRVREAEKALEDFRKERKERNAPPEIMSKDRRWGIGFQPNKGEDPEQKKRDDAHEASLGEQIKLTKEQSDEIAKLSGLDNERLENLIKSEEEVRAQREDVAKGAEARSKEAKAGLDIGAKIEEDTSALEDQITTKKKSLEEDKKSLQLRTDAPARKEALLREAKDLRDQQRINEARAKEAEAKAIQGVPQKEVEDKQKKFREEEAAIVDLEKKRMKARGQAEDSQGDSSAKWRSKLEKLEHSKAALIGSKVLQMLETEKPEADPEKEKARRAKIDKQRRIVERDKALAGGEVFEQGDKGIRKMATYRAKLGTAERREAQYPQYKEEEREGKIQKYEVETEIEAGQKRRKGDIYGGEAAEDKLSFMKNFQQLVPLLGEKMAAKVGLAKTGEEIEQQYEPARQIVSSMTAVGGGGGVSQVDPTMESNRRREQLQTRMVELLTLLTGQQPEEKAPTNTFQ